VDLFLLLLSALCAIYAVDPKLITNHLYHFVKSLF
jgi:hypothetical protein